VIFSRFVIKTFREILLLGPYPPPSSLESIIFSFLPLGKSTLNGGILRGNSKKQKNIAKKLEKMKYYCYKERV